MQTSGLDLIDDLPPELAGQQALLRGLLALCDADDRIRWLVIGCSLARGAGDRLSEKDMAMGIRDEDFDAARPDLRRAVDGLGELIESYHHQLPAVTQAHERIFAQFADRSQVDLVLFPASVRAGRPGQVPAPRVQVGGPGQTERGTVPVVATLGRYPGRARPAVRTDQRPGFPRPRSSRRVSRTPWRTWTPGGCWTRGGGSPYC
jgi:hypothetical protein